MTNKSNVFSAATSAALSAGQVDAIDLLKKDHKHVKTLFEQFESEKEGDRDDLEDLVAEICLELTIHSQVEEEIFYPAVREELGDELVDEATVEHASAKELIDQLSEMSPDDELFDAKVKVLSEQIDHHVEEEEGEMFPQVKKSKIDTEALGAEMAARKTALMEESEVG